MTLKLISRAGWQPSADLGPPMPTKPGGWIADEAWLHHTVTGCTTNPIEDVRFVELIGIQRFGRMSYSYLYHWLTRTWYEGAGATIGAHTGGRNSRSFGLAIIGNTEHENPPHLAEDTADLLHHLIDRNLLAPHAQAHVYPPDTPWHGTSYPTGGHRDQKATACPGRHAYARIPEIRALVKAGKPSTPPTPTPTPPVGELTMADIDTLMARLDRLEQNVAQKATAFRDPRDGTIWIVGPDGTRRHLPNPGHKAVNLQAFIGVLRPGGDKYVHPIAAENLDLIPIAD